MKAIIDGKRYDTETATEIGTGGSLSVPRGDFDWYTETLYRTKGGSWFLAGEGGARTRYAEIVHGGSRGGERIIVLTDSEARDWLESERMNEALEQYFEIKDA